MIKQFLITFLLLSTLACFAQERPKVVLGGRVVDNNYQAIPYAHIVKADRRSGQMANHEGEFAISVYVSDTLFFSATGYKPQQIIIPPSGPESIIMRIIRLQTDTIMLPETVIHPWPETYEEFAQEFVSGKKIPEKPMASYVPTSQDLGFHKNMLPQGGIAIPGPVSMLYELFSHKAKARRKYYALIEKDNLHQSAMKKISHRMISTVADIAEDDVDDFLTYCALSDEKILSLSEYEIYQRVVDCLPHFAKEKKRQTQTDTLKPTTTLPK